MDAAQSFDAQAFHPELPGGRSRGRLTVLHDSLRFDAADRSVLLPLSGLQPSLGGAGNRLVFLNHANHPDWRLYVSDPAFLADPRLHEHPSFQAILRSRRRHRALGWGGILLALALLALIPFAAYLSLDTLSAVVANQVPMKWEESLGRTAITQYKVQKRFLPERESEALLRPLVAPLLRQTGDSRPYHFYVVDDGELNAFALPGGYIVVHSGLILKASKADQLQGVLAHEITHVTERHGLRTVIRGVGIYVLAQALIGDASGLLASVASAAPLLVNQKYSRDFEREADHKGVDLLYKARIQPEGLAAFFTTIRDQQRRQLEQIGKVGEAARTANAYFGSHPDSDERILTLRARIQKLPAQTWRDDSVTFSALRKRVQDFVSKPMENRQ
jgi:predicted Zn-dependent protease